MTVLSTDTMKKEETKLSEFFEETKDGDGQIVGVVSHIPQKPVTTPKPGEKAAAAGSQPKAAPRRILTTSGLDALQASSVRRTKTAEILAQRASLAAEQQKGTKAEPKAGDGGKKTGGGQRKAGAK